MEFRHLRYFIAVAEEAHFSRAAERLGISQPPLSMQIQALERELRVKLFARTRRSVRLTAAGEFFLARARRIVRDAQDLSQDVLRAHKGQIGHISVGFNFSLGYGLIPPIVRAFRSAYPDVAITLREMRGSQQVKELRSGEIDISVTWPDVFTGAVKSEPLLEEFFVIALRNDHPVASVRRPSISLVADEDFISFPRHQAPAPHDAMVALCGKAGFIPRIRQETGTFHTALGLVAAGLGVAIIPTSATDIISKDIVFRLPKETEPRLLICLNWREDHQSPILKGFTEIAKRVASSYAAEKKTRLSSGRKT